ncbi:flavin reductase family protein [Aliamphritea ceti]|uniref:flavin reductase family protein n=1 Tax=Aliamphritea ceti TaxID=1524258 RepID=UPI0021C38359|nr:flavin reductase family protein [Aliamphritea ceti]
MSNFDPRELRNAFGSFMTGVTVVTAVSESGEKVGFTANSFTSVSVEPSLLLVCPGKNLSSFDIFNSCEHFAINILAEDQQQVSNTFASSKGDRFAEINWHADQHGSPLIDNAVAHFSCKTFNRIDAGDHVILIGEISAFASNDKLGLGYAKGGYFSLGMEHRAEQLSKHQGSIVGAIIEHEDKVLLSRTSQGYTLPQVAADVQKGSLESVREYLTSNGLNCQLGAVYSIYENLDAKQNTCFYRASSEQADTTRLGEYVEVAKLADLDYVSADIASVMTRYADEKQHGVFRLYVGDQQHGNIH